MEVSYFSMRRKILFPAAVAVLATIFATGVSLVLSSRAAARLDTAEERDFKALQLSQGMLAMLQRLQLLLQNFGSSGDAFTLDIADGVLSEMRERLEGDGKVVLGVKAAAERRAALDQYGALARKVAIAAAGRSMGTQKKAATEEERARSLEADSQYEALSGVWTRDAEAARTIMTTGFHEAKTRQRLSILVGAGILLLSALGSLAFGAWISGRLSRPIQRLSEIALRVADGDLRDEVAPESADEVGVLADSFRRMVDRLRHLVSTLQSAAGDLASAAERLSGHTRAQSLMLERQASGVAETSTTTRELEQASSVAASRASSVLDVARRAAEMSETGREAAERSADELRRIQGSVEGIVGQSTTFLEQARAVSDIVETVRDLATQSHVLSLNASIEAAKAGEAGRSFAVVAQEVRALAEQSGQGAERIGKMVEQMLTAVESTRDLTARGGQGIAGSLEEVRASGQSLREIGGVVRETSDAALQIASAVQQQSIGIVQIAQAMREIERGMAESVEQIRTLEGSAQLVGETATRISGVASEFQV
jgi:methyl-accepting chemotaxis protein